MRGVTGYNFQNLCVSSSENRLCQSKQCIPWVYTFCQSSQLEAIDIEKGAMHVFGICFNAVVLL